MVDHFQLIVRFNTKQNSIMVKGIINAFDHYGIMFSFSGRKNISVKISVFFSKKLISSLPIFATGGKWNFQEANLLLATVNFEL